MPNVGPDQLAQIRELARQWRAAIDKEADMRAAVYQLAADLRDQYPGRGTVTAMADAITEELGDDSAHRRTSLSRTISAIRAGRRTVKPPHKVHLPDD